MPRFAVLRDLSDLEDVAAFWPLASIEKVALWVYPAEDQGPAERFAAERFPAQEWVVLALDEAESIVRQHLESARRRRKGEQIRPFFHAKPQRIVKKSTRIVQKPRRID